MIEPGIEDVGKRVIMNCGAKSKGTITWYNDKFVYVKFRNENFPQAIKRRFLRWNREACRINRIHAIF